MADIVLHRALVVTMDPARRILTETSVLIRDGRIVAIGNAQQLDTAITADAIVIDCKRKAVLPGLVDLHGYLGGSILKSLGEELDGSTRRNLMERILTRLIDEDWWRIETRLAALERLKFGTTFMFSMMGGNGTRTDDPTFARVSRDELARIGLRTRIGLGPTRPPWPQTFSTWRDGQAVDKNVSFETVMGNCETLLAEQAERPNPLVDYCAALSRIGNRNEHDPVWSPDKEVWVHRQAEAMRHLIERFGVGFWTHMYGNSIEYAHDHSLGLLGPRSILSHCIDIGSRSVDIIRETGSHVAHHPRAGRVFAHPGRIPLPEMIDAGITVGLGADVPANHDCDIFLDMKAAMRQQRIHFRDGRVLPPGKALEMATIDGYKALGLDNELGSLEVGKKADLITVDLDQPHLTPIDMPIYRLVYQATGRDVSDVIVDGRVVMRNRRVETIDEAQVLADAQAMYRRVIERGDLARYTEPSGRFWGASHA